MVQFVKNKLNHKSIQQVQDDQVDVSAFPKISAILSRLSPEPQRSSGGRRATAPAHAQPPQDKRPHGEDKRSIHSLPVFPHKGANLNPASPINPPTAPGAVAGLLSLHQTAAEDLPSALPAPGGERRSLRQ